MVKKKSSKTKKKITKIKTKSKIAEKMPEKTASSVKKSLISTEIVEKVAKIARLNLTTDEKERFRKDLNDILAAFKILDEAKADEKPSFQPYDIKDVLRDDKEDEPLGQKALDNTKHKEKGFIKGPRVV